MPHSIWCATSRRFSSISWGGARLRMMLEAKGLSDIQDALLRHRALIGRHVFESDVGSEESLPALIPANRVEMVILDER